MLTVNDKLIVFMWMANFNKVRTGYNLKVCQNAQWDVKIEKKIIFELIENSANESFLIAFLGTWLTFV